MLQDLGVLQHHDAITGTSVPLVSDDFFKKAHSLLQQVEELNTKVLARELEKQHDIKLDRLDAGILSREVNDKYYSPYHSKKEFLIVVQNPTNQMHEELLQAEVPYREFELLRLNHNGTQYSVEYDQFTPKVMFNSENKVIKNMISFPIKFEADEDHHVYLVKNSGEAKNATHVPNQLVQGGVKVDTTTATKSNFLNA
jgi:hypothetical protein